MHPALENSLDEAIRELAASQYFISARKRVENLTYDKFIVLQSRDSMNQRWTELLYNSVDGRGLRHSGNLPFANSWVQQGGGYLTGNEFVESVRLRINCCPTRARTSRGRPEKICVCRAGCVLPGGTPARETLPHVLQKCHRTHGVRIKRHDWALERVAEWLVKDGWFLIREGNFRSTAGQVLKPDLVISRPKIESAYVLDVQVISDHSGINAGDRLKMAAYRRSTFLRGQVMNVTGKNTVSSTELLSRGEAFGHSRQPNF